jgi:enoyl-[acyl-carrier protein] reductase III
MSYDFSGKIALITGSGRGIGRAIALHFARLGADVVVNYLRKQSAAEETAHAIEGLGRRALVVKANVGDPDELDRLFETVAREWGGLDFLINNAASGYIRPISEQKVKGWDWTMNINARAALFASQRAAPMMRQRGGGAIVNVSSIGSRRTLPDYVVIGASKGALEAITRYCAVEFAPWNITVNCVAPGIIHTDALQFFKDSDLMLKLALERTPAGRLVTPEDVAKVIAFLCSPDAAMIRGQVITIDGGWSIDVGRQWTPAAAHS